MLAEESQLRVEELFEPGKRPLKVLLLEDLDSDADIIQLKFKKFEHEVDCFHVKNKQEYLEALNHGPYDCIISDYGLLQYTGMDAVKELRSKDAYTPFIICTGNLNEETAVACIKAGADDYVLKESLGRLNSAIAGAILAKRNLLEKEQAESELIELNQRLTALTHHLQNVRDEEKKKIAMEIHDQLGQELTGNKLGLYWIQQQIKQHGIAKVNEEEVQDKITYLLDLNTKTIDTVRRIAHQLRPVVLDDIGLIPALEWHVNNFNKNDKCKCGLILDAENVTFKKELSTAIYRIAQEALTNINRHAQASEANLALYADSKFLHLVVEDNGVGAIKEEALKSRSLGLFGMRERLKPWNGKWDMQTAPNQGTKIHIKIELQNIH